MKVGVWAYGGGIQAAATLGDDGAEIGQGRETLIGDRLVHQRPQPLGGRGAHGATSSGL